MAWTAPRTFTAGSAPTASDLNTFVRDNMLETIAAKATDSGGLFCANGVNSVAERLGKKSFVNTNESTTSTTFTDLATAGPSVTITSGPGGAVCWWCCTVSNTTTAISVMSVVITGAAAGNTAASASDERAISTTNLRGISQFVFYDGLTEGSNTFTAKYRVTGGTGSFRRRRLVVFPM